MQYHSRSIMHFFVLFALLASLLGSAITVKPARAASLQTDIVSPSGSGQFGRFVRTLPNGNFVVVDPLYDAPGPIVDVGAVYLYNGATHALISTLTGSTAGDQIGSNEIAVLTNGNFVVISPLWNNGAVVDVGAVTWGSGTTGVSGVVSASNSLVGSTAYDQSELSGGVLSLTNGNYVVISPRWNNGAVADVGAITWGSGTTGVSGVISAVNSLVGTTVGDGIGSGTNISVRALANGNYVVSSPLWNNGAVVDVGAVTWGNGTTGVSGVVSASNSLVGSTASDKIGSSGIPKSSGIIKLTNGNYVVESPNWDGAAANVGAVTWGSGTTGISGMVSATNSLVGSTASDSVGSYGVTELTNGNYVVGSAGWDGAAANVGAVTWGSGTTGISGVVSATNSLVGSTTSDYVGSSGVIALTNGNYVVRSAGWDGAAVNVGAATWGNGISGTVGAVSAVNSLVGSIAGDQVSVSGVTALTNGNYVVASYLWDGVAGNVGATTWGNGTGGTVGAVSAVNSLVGSTLNDNVGYSQTWPLANGNYVVISDNWDNGAVVDVGAITWCNGAGGTVGAVSSANSLVGTTVSDQIGSSSIIPLPNGNYVAASPSWDNGAVVDVGAVTWGNGAGGTVGTVSAANSLVGSTANDQVGLYRDIYIMANGDYVVSSTQWDGVAVDSGAVTFAKSASTPLVGPITAVNSVRGSAASGGTSMYMVYDEVNDQLVVGRPADNIVTLFKITLPSVTSSVRANPSPTNLASVDFTVTFSESVTGVDVSDFTLTTSGVSGAAVSGISGTGSVYTVTVTTGSGKGTIRLDVLDDNTIKDSDSNSLGIGFTGGEVYSVATFMDVPSDYWANSYIERLYNAGITGGCATSPSLMYCPDNSVTRAQMAVFLLKGMHGSGFTPPAINGSIGFTDVATDHWAAAWIKQLAAEGITSGCGAGVYCPEATVTRAQMAVFLLKAKHGSSYTPPAATGIFSDVPLGYWADKWIERLAAEGVTSGCGAGIYCPDADVTRAQMAVFLVKAFGLP